MLSRPIFTLMVAVVIAACCGCAVTGPITGNTYRVTVRSRTDLEWLDQVEALDTDDKVYLRELRLAEYLGKDHDAIDPELVDVILAGEVRIGMPKELVEISWGKPRNVNRTMSAHGVSEQWVYGDPLHRAQYLYFENGILTTIQDVN